MSPPRRMLGSQILTSRWAVDRMRSPGGGRGFAARSLGRCSSVVLPAQQGQQARAPPLRCCPLPRRARPEPRSRLGCLLPPAVTQAPARDPHRLLRSFRRGPLPAGQTPGCPRPSAVWAQTSLPSASSPTQPSGPVLPLPHEQKTKLRLVLQTRSLLPTPGLSPGSALRPSHLPPLPPTARGGSVVTRAWAVEPTATDPQQTTRAAELFNRASVSSSEK